MKIQINKSKLLNLFTLNRYTASEWLCAAFLLASIPPFYFWGTKIPVVAAILCSTIMLQYASRNRSNLLYCMLFVILYSYSTIRSGSNIAGTIMTLSICVFFVCSDTFLLKVWNKFILIFSITLIPSLVVYTLVNLLNIDLPHQYIEPLNKLKTDQYIQYPFMVQSTIYLILPRFYGFYDEPGVVGTIAAVLLCSDGFNLQKWYNIPIFIAGVLSFSLFFNIVMLFYGLAYLRMRQRILFITILVGLFTLSDNEVLDTYIFSRFNIENNELVGDNRTGENFEVWYNESFRKTDAYWWGIGTNTENVGGASYKDIIVKYGIVFFAAYYILFIFLLYNKMGINQRFVLSVFILIAVLYQRPFIVSHIYVFIIYVSAISLYRRHEVKFSENHQKEVICIH